MGIASKSASRQARLDSELIAFLEQGLGLSSDAIDLGLRQSRTELAPLPITLWRYGLVSLRDLEAIYDWQERHGRWATVVDTAGRAGTVQ
ncbi:MAG: DUF2949 domain-containing protein [Aphanocapsa feldmannii 277cV]|uniref:DUF2949 domain-containing protein n=2 Tax=Aphanocapsa feldmannii TaxID=192050 RepID=A0A524RMK3_9CHRO|nr:MAG: DUF2949 domain-containing protein [Aphanocapsa feldmannii 288cV]TGG91867.1 MAG: DUF2949 domain-containing protein [Aphanocapsa feldmannii 277cV]TGH21762.1 MAG: DUF2949 domain-containing protein [Aphanocapsa feldmannii 277cI]